MTVEELRAALARHPGDAEVHLELDLTRGADGLRFFLGRGNLAVTADSGVVSIRGAARYRYRRRVEDAEHAA